MSMTDTALSAHQYWLDLATILGDRNVGKVSELDESDREFWFDAADSLMLLEGFSDKFLTLH